jgi:hypothetical protein
VKLGGYDGHGCRVYVPAGGYKSLQTEIIQRNTQFLVIATASMTGAFSVVVAMFSDKIELWKCVGFPILFVILIIMLLTFLWVHRDTKAAEKRLIEIEDYVNSACKAAPGALFPLSWQRRFGMSARGKFSLC